MTEPPPADAVCIPEWCETLGKDGTHSEVCPQHPFAITKGELVERAESIAEHGITAYLVMAGDGFTHEEALEMAKDEVREAVTCYVGIGSCGRGWCQHN